MTPFEAYKKYLALKLYFTKDYDYFKYNGSTSASIDTFKKRRDQYQFQKLANHKDVEGLIVSNYLANEKISWVGDLITEEAQETYDNWLAKQESLSYVFSQEIGLLGDDLTEFKSSFKIKEGKVPQIVKKVLKKEISYETLNILDDVLHFFDYYNDKMGDSIIWPDISKISTKYKPFMKYDLSKFRKIIVNKYKCQ